MDPAAEHLTRWLVWLTNETLQASLLVGAIWLLLKALGWSMTPGWRCGFWSILVLRLLCPWRPASRFSLYQILPHIEADSLFVRTSQSVRPAEGAALYGWSWLWVLLWLVGALVLTGYILASHWRLMRRVAREHAVRSPLAWDILEACCTQLDVKTTPRLQLTRHVQVPTLVGCVRPCLLLPRSMVSLFSRRRLQHVFLHELAHYKRKDIALRWLAALCQVLHWFNPLVWLAFHQMRCDCELACDQLALSRLDQTQPRQYGQTLIRLIEHLSCRHRMMAMAVGLAQDRFQLRKRLRTIVRFKPLNGVSRNWPVLPLALLALTGLTDAQSPADSPALFENGSAATQPSGQSGQYYAILREQPGNTYLFDRFYNTWQESGTLEELETLLAEALDRYHSRADRLLLAFFYEKQGQDREALRLYREGTEGQTADADYLYYKARAESRHLEFDAAISDLVQARSLEGSPEVAEKTGKLLGELYIRTHQKDKAADLWAQLLATGTENLELYEDLIELQIKEGLFDDALKTSEDLIAKTTDPQQVVIRRLRRGDIYQYKADTEKALAAYSEALDQVGQGSWLEKQIFSQIEQVFNRAEDREGLRVYLTDLVKGHPQRTGMKKQLANLLVEAGRTDEALDLLQEILQAAPGDKSHQMAYVETLTNAGRLDQAITLLEQLSQRHDQDAEILISLADLYHMNKEDNRVPSVLERFLDLSDKTEYEYLRVAGILERYALVDRADEVYRQMSAALPESLSARQVYAEFLYQQDKTEEALALFRTVVGQGNLQLMIRASNAAGTRGHYDRALAWLEARYDEFSSDVTYLNHLCKVAIRLEAFDKAAIWAQHQLELAETYPMIRAALSQVLVTVGQGENAARLLRSLEAMGVLTIQQTCLVSELLELQNRSGQADARLTEAAKQHPELALRQQIHLDRKRGDWERAAASMESLISRTGKREALLIQELIELYQKGRQFDRAIQWTRAWRDISPASAAPWLRHAQLLRDQGKNAEALTLLEGAQREFAEHQELLLQLAELYRSTGRLAEAERVYWRLYEVAEKAPEKVRTIQQLAELAGKSGHRAELIDKLKRQQQALPTSALPLLALAEVYKLEGNYEERRQALLEASRIQTDDVELLYELARVEEGQGDWEKALDTLDRALALHPTRETRLKAARLSIQHGEEEAGLRILTEIAGALDVGPRDAESIAGTLMSMGRWDMAVRFLQGLLSSHPTDYRLHYQYALSLEEAKRWGQALEAFVDLLGFRDEIPGNKGKRIGFSWQRQGLETNIQQILPAEAIDLLQLSQYHHRAYRYRRDRANAQRSGQRPGRRAIHVTLPPTVDDLSHFAVSHIVQLAGELGPGQRVQVKYDLERHGIANSGLLLAMGEGGLDGFRETIESMAQDRPDDKAIQAVWLLHRIEGKGATLQEAQHLYDLFERSHRRLACIIGLRCYGKERIASRLFTESLRKLRGIPNPGYYEVMAIAFALQVKASPVTLTDQQRADLDEHLIDWFARLNKTTPNRTYIFNYVAWLLAEQDDLLDFVKFLDEEIANGAPGSSTSVFNPSVGGLVADLSCPPATLPGFPDHVLKKLLDVPRGQGRSYSGEVKTSASRFGPYVDRAKDPTLKILLAMLAERQEEAERLTREFALKTPTALAPYFLNASLASKAERPLDALAHLDRARSLPLSARDRSLIDGALVAAGLKLDAGKHPQAIDIARQAAMRLMSQRLDPWEREELIVAAETLGLTEQAITLKSGFATSGHAQGGFAGRPMFFRADGPGLDTIEAYFERGQTDSALRLALDCLRNAVGASSGTYFRSGLAWRTDPLIKMLRDHRAVDRVIELAEPDEGASVSKVTNLAEYARICELLGARDRSLAAYRKAIALSPQDADANLDLALLSARTAPQESARYLLAIDRRHIHQAGLELAEHLKQLHRQGQVEEALTIVDSVTEYLGRVGDPNRVPLQWIDRVAGATTEPIHQPRFRLDHLYQPQLPQMSQMSRVTGRGGQFSFSMSATSRSGRAQALTQRFQSGNRNPLRENRRLAEARRSSHNQLCQTMLDIPQLAEAAFSRLLAEANARLAETPSFSDTARRVMFSAESPPQSGPATASSRGGPRFGFFGMQAIGPAEFLVQEAYDEGRLDELLDELLPELEQRKKVDQAEKLKSHAKAYANPSTNPIALANRFPGRLPGVFPTVQPSQTPNSVTRQTQGQTRARRNREISQSRRRRPVRERRRSNNN